MTVEIRPRELTVKEPYSEENKLTLQTGDVITIIDGW